MQKVGEVGYAEGMAAGDVGVEGTAPGDGRVARMAPFILDAIDPSVDSSGLTGSCRHGALGGCVNDSKGQQDCGTMDGESRPPWWKKP